MRSKKLVSLATAATLAVTALPLGVGCSSATAAESSKYNYAEALQKSMFFYEVQQCGELPDWNEVSWRADCMVNDEVPGGWFDAGDHIKFTLTNAYTATMLAWGIYAYKDAVKKAGLYELYMNNLQWGLDYVAACDRGTKVVSTIADDAFDHVWWGSAEVYMAKYVLKGGKDPRPFDETTSTTTVGEMAAALAAGYLVFKDENPTLAENYLTHAKSLFKLADSTRSNKGQGVQKTYYNTEQSGTEADYMDELFYAANWLYMATGDKSYLDKCVSDYIPAYPLENQSTDRKFTWGMCWDDKSQAAALLYAYNTGDEEWIDQVYRHLEYWTTGYNGKQITYTPDGLAWLFNWGATRHATTTAFMAKFACDTIFKDDAEKCSKYNEFAKKQVDYCLGDNKLGMSYVLGMGEKNPKSWHHRTSSGVWDDKWSELGKTKEYAHTLYGALEGGPGQDGSFKDEVNAYENTEVAIDYNAGYTACLCALIDDYGGEKLANFPPVETPKWDEFYMEACINQSSGSYTEIKANTTNHSAWPARIVKDLSYNYYFDLTEVLDAGLTADDVQVRIGYDEWSNAEISNPIQYKDNIYYVKISYKDGSVVMPTGQSEHQGEIQFRVGVSDQNPVWDSSNDYSFDGLVKQDMNVTDKITMYDGDTLIWGTEPDGTKPEPYSGGKNPSTGTTPTTTSTTSTTTTTTTTSTSVTTTTESTTSSTSTSTQPGGNDGDLYLGDVNCDQKITVSDAILLNRLASSDTTVDVTAQGIRNADVDGVKGLSANDVTSVLKVVARLIEQSDLRAPQ